MRVVINIIYFQECKEGALYSTEVYNTTFRNKEIQVWQILHTEIIENQADFYYDAPSKKTHRCFLDRKCHVKAEFLAKSMQLQGPV